MTDYILLFRPRKFGFLLHLLAHSTCQAVLDRVTVPQYYLPTAESPNEPEAVHRDPLDLIRLA